MMKEKPSSHTISGVFVFLLLGIFAVFSTVMVLLGARAYKGAAERAALHNDQRLAAAYVRSMARAGDEADFLRVEEADGLQTLTMETFDAFGDSFITRVYVYDGMLRELYYDAVLPFQPELGEPVCAAEDMRAWINGKLLTVSLKNGGVWTTVDTALRAAGH